MTSGNRGHPENYALSNSGDLSLPELFMERPRLSQLFEHARQRQLVTVCAGAGYGKSSAVFSLLRSRQAWVNWIHLSERDNVEESFWDKYIHTVYARVPELMQSLLQVGVPKTKYEYEQYFSFIAAYYPISAATHYTEYIFVFDDLHTLTNPNLLQFIDRGLRFRQPNKTTVLISRTDPLVYLPCLAAENIAPAITEEDLRFTESETADYLRRQGLTVSTQGVRDIHRDTQGWVFALALVVRSLQKSPEYRSDIFSAMRNNVFRIFDAEVFNVVSQRLKHFLIRLSLLDRLPAELLGELSGDSALIAEMELQSAYIRYDPYMNTYMIHQLLLDYLREQQHLLSDEDKRDTYKKAGAYCERNSYKSDALAYYEKAGDYHALIDLVYSGISMQIPRDIAENLLRILESAPDTMALTVDLLPTLHLRTLLSLGRFPEAIELGLNYEKRFLALPETQKTAALLAGIYMHMGIAFELIQVQEDSCSFGVYYKKLSDLYDTYPFPSTGAAAVMMAGTWICAIGTARTGAPEAFIAECEVSEPWLIRAQNGYGAGRSELAAAELMFYRNETRETERLLLSGMQKARTHGQSSLVVKALIYSMRLAFVRGNVTGAARALADIKDILSDEDYLSRYATYDTACGWYYLKLGQPEQVPDWLKSDFLPVDHPKFLECLGNQIKMLYCYTTGNYSALLSYTGSLGQRKTGLYERLESQAMEACALYLTKDRSAAFAALQEAWETAKPNQLVMPLIELGKDMRTLTAAALRENRTTIPKAWLQSVNRQASAYAKYQAQISRSARTDGGDMRLSAREMDILAALSRGLSRSEIAENLGLSTNTVKMYTGSLYEKIGASNMADAIRIGVGKGLI